jgi:hypothetical protein
LKIRRWFAVYADGLARPWVNELEARGVQRDARDSPLGGLGRVVLAVADDGMADRRKLYADLIL